jgi:hypothetical protein
MASQITPKQKKDATVDILNHITEVLFYFFEEQEDNLEDDGVLNDFVGTMWDIAIVSMASCGMNVQNVSPDGTYTVSFRPAKSVKEFLLQEDYAEEDQMFFEDVVEEIPGEPALGVHGESFLAES